jgi:long-subunit acyl-CoA synthetase (AMP-forming)
VGDQRKYNVCLLTLKTVVNPETGVSTGALTGDAARVSDAKTDMEAIAESKKKGSKWEAYLSAGLAELNAKHSVSNAQKIQKYHVLPGDFSEKGGELTPTLKLKRTVAADKYKDVIDAMY